MLETHRCGTSRSRKARANPAIQSTTNKKRMTFRKIRRAA